MSEAFEVLLTYASIGRFLAYQLVTDLNYSEHLAFAEDEFVEPGPGARDGISKCFDDLGDLTPSDVIRWTMEAQAAEFERRDTQFHNLWGRPLHLIDCQNLYCEVGKYARAAHPEAAGPSGRTRIKQHFRPRHDPLTAWYTSKSGVNAAVVTWLERHPERINITQPDLFTQ